MQVTIPTLIIHGQEDRLVPVAHGRTLWKVCGGRKMLVTPADMHHNNPLFADAEHFVLPMINFFCVPDYSFNSDIGIPPRFMKKRLCLPQFWEPYKSGLTALGEALGFVWDDYQQQENGKNASQQTNAKRTTAGTNQTSDQGSSGRSRKSGSSSRDARANANATSSAVDFPFPSGYTDAYESNFFFSSPGQSARQEGKRNTLPGERGKHHSGSNEGGSEDAPLARHGGAGRAKNSSQHFTEPHFSAGMLGDGEREKGEGGVAVGDVFGTVNLGPDVSDRDTRAAVEEMERALNRQGRDYWPIPVRTPVKGPPLISLPAASASPNSFGGRKRYFRKGAQRQDGEVSSNVSDSTIYEALKDDKKKEKKGHLTDREDALSRFWSFDPSAAFANMFSSSNGPGEDETKTSGSRSSGSDEGSGEGTRRERDKPERGKSRSYLQARMGKVTEEGSLDIGTSTLRIPWPMPKEGDEEIPLPSYLPLERDRTGLQIQREQRSRHKEKDEQSSQRTSLLAAELLLEKRRELKTRTGGEAEAFPHSRIVQPSDSSEHNLHIARRSGSDMRHRGVASSSGSSSASPASPVLLEVERRRNEALFFTLPTHAAADRKAEDRREIEPAYSDTPLPYSSTELKAVLRAAVEAAAEVESEESSEAQQGGEQEETRFPSVPFFSTAASQEDPLRRSQERKSGSVHSNCRGGLWPFNSGRNDVSQPISNQRTDISRPISNNRSDISRPISNNRSDISRPISNNRSDISRPISNNRRDTPIPSAHVSFTPLLSPSFSTPFSPPNSLHRLPEREAGVGGGSPKGKETAKGEPVVSRETENSNAEWDLSVEDLEDVQPVHRKMVERAAFVHRGASGLGSVSSSDNMGGASSILREGNKIDLPSLPSVSPPSSSVWSVGSHSSGQPSSPHEGAAFGLGIHSGRAPLDPPNAPLYKMPAPALPPAQASRGSPAERASAWAMRTRPPPPAAVDEPCPCPCPADDISVETPPDPVPPPVSTNRRIPPQQRLSSHTPTPHAPSTRLTGREKTPPTVRGTRVGRAEPQPQRSPRDLHYPNHSQDRHHHRHRQQQPTWWTSFLRGVGVGVAS
uniref:Serine aminopeptidase S33 domain-containing protein n=1 Tax=Chromera velia CCMP2878 TaxID=1169474 RepID=A0A0G4H208_9ALVE|eukprot:Cvel_24381.t1-p1 / transcript=Cvel_24381.t1 / gene=Cvel_24381 / organism=Chromera_velia_CCMP2878 / gene_product=hypothetical protein / transcript_product=hypothetical protein / location=Cvel_scaffold2628:175-6395(+) / protein_length=1083 / sequence_SO=supercontig / SO=protein_coding / is_pseudo=false